jgi:hypothetical protein
MYSADHVNSTSVEYLLANVFSMTAALFTVRTSGPLCLLLYIYIYLVSAGNYVDNNHFRRIFFFGSGNAGNIFLFNIQHTVSFEYVTFCCVHRIFVTCYPSNRKVKIEKNY